MDVKNNSMMALSAPRNIAAALSLVMLAPGPAMAVLEELIFTAQKREENVQSVSIAVSAFSAETIRYRARGGSARTIGHPVWTQCGGQGTEYIDQCAGH